MIEHKYIYLEPQCSVDPNGGRMWCQDDSPDGGCDCHDGPHPWVRYVKDDGDCVLTERLTNEEALLNIEATIAPFLPRSAANRKSAAKGIAVWIEAMINDQPPPTRLHPARRLRLPGAA